MGTVGPPPFGNPNYPPSQYGPPIPPPFGPPVPPPNLAPPMYAPSFRSVSPMPNNYRPESHLDFPPYNPTYPGDLPDVPLNPAMAAQMGRPSVRNAPHPPSFVGRGRPSN